MPALFLFLTLTFYSLFIKEEEFCPKISQIYQAKSVFF